MATGCAMAVDWWLRKEPEQMLRLRDRRRGCPVLHDGGWAAHGVVTCAVWLFVVGRFFGRRGSARDGTEWFLVRGKFAMFT